MHVGVQGQWSAVQDDQQGVESLDAVYAVGKHHGAPRVLEQEVIKVEILLLLLTVDTRLSQRLRCRLLPGEVDDFGFGFDPHFLHENLQLAPLVQILLLLLQEAGGQAVGHCQGGGEHKRLPRGIKVNSVEHLQQTLQLCKVASFYHAIGFVDDQAPAE